MATYHQVGFEEFIEDSVKSLTDKAEWMKGLNMRLLSSMQELTDFVDKAIAAKICALDLETTGLSTRTKKVLDPSSGRIFHEPVNKIVGIGLSCSKDEGVYVPLNHIEGRELNLNETNVIDEIKRLCLNCTIIVHNAKFDLAMLDHYGVIVTRHTMFEDTLILARLFDAGSKEIGLKHLSEVILNQKMITFEEATGHAERFDLVSPKISYVYVCSDAICTFQLFHFFMAQDVIKGQMKIYNLEKRTVRVVMEMEANLVQLDVPYLKASAAKIQARLEEIRKEIYKLVGKEFDIASPQQLGRILFEELGYRYPDKERTKSGQYKTDDTTLQKIAGDYPVVAKITEFRVLEKNLGTYINKLLLNVDEDECVKLGFNQNGTDTGRFSSPGGRGINVDGYCGVNIQSLPSTDADGLPAILKENPIRRAFIARPGYTIVAMDYSGEELRVATNLSLEPNWVEEFLNGSGDLHTKTAQVIFNKQNITKPERKLSKVANFLTLYGGGPTALAGQAKISVQEAQRIMAAYFAGLPKLKKWIDVERARARKLKKSRTALGRIRPLAMFYNSGDKGLEAHGDRCAVNFEIQGTSADIMKTCMVRVYNWIHREGLQNDIRTLITMHDELVFEIKSDMLEKYIPMLNTIMKLEDILQGLLKWPVPFAVDAEYGPSWDVHNDFFKEHPELAKAGKVEFRNAGSIPPPPVNSTAPAPEPTVPATPPEPAAAENPVNLESIISVPEPSPEPSPETPKMASGAVSEPTQIPAEVLSEKSNLAEATKPLPNGGSCVYTVRDTTAGTLRRMNHVLMFLADEMKATVGYESPTKQMVIRDRQGNVLGEVPVKFDAFLSLARYFGV